MTWDRMAYLSATGMALFFLVNALAAAVVALASLVFGHVGDAFGQVAIGLASLAFALFCWWVRRFYDGHV